MRVASRYRSYANVDGRGRGRIGRCIDGNGVQVLPVNPNDPAWMCALNPRMADGFSVAFAFSAVRANIVGVSD